MSGERVIRNNLAISYDGVTSGGGVFWRHGKTAGIRIHRRLLFSSTNMSAVKRELFSKTSNGVRRHITRSSGRQWTGWPPEQIATGHGVCMRRSPARRQSQTRPAGRLVACILTVTETVEKPPGHEDCCGLMKITALLCGWRCMERHNGGSGQVYLLKLQRKYVIRRQRKNGYGWRVLWLEGDNRMAAYGGRLGSNNVKAVTRRQTAHGRKATATVQGIAATSSGTASALLFCAVLNKARTYRVMLSAVVLCDQARWTVLGSL